MDLTMDSIIEKLKKALDLLADHMIRVRSNLAIIQGLKETVEEKPEYTNLMNQSVAFWHMTIQNDRSQLAYVLSKVFDTGIDVISIKSIIETCAKNEHVLKPIFDEINASHDGSTERLSDYAALMQRVQETYDNSSDLIEKLKRIRNKQIAHLDKQMALGIKESLSLEWNEIEKLADIAEGIINTISVSLFDSVYYFHVLDDEKDVKKLLLYAMLGYTQTKEQRKKARIDKAQIN